MQFSLQCRVFSSMFIHSCCTFAACSVCFIWGFTSETGSEVFRCHQVWLSECHIQFQSLVGSAQTELTFLPSCKENMLKSSPVLRWHKCAVTSYFLKSVKRIQIVTITGLIYKREPLSRHMFLSLSKAWGSSEGKTISFTLNCLGLEYIAQKLFLNTPVSQQSSCQARSHLAKFLEFCQN